MNVFWVFVPGAVLLTLGLVIFEWRNHKQLSGAAAAGENAGEEANSAE
ncbi:MAG TPA: hypothetical protein VH599_02305 [Ktedonobacterales bacterium]|jgi:hypothetical protein